MSTRLNGSYGRFSALACLLTVTGVACSGSEKDDTETQTGIHLQAIVPENDTDVTDIEYTIQQVSCETGTPIGSAIVATRPLEGDQVIPGGSPELQDKPLDKGSAHFFADAFEVVPAGCYDVSAAPLAGSAASEDCAAASKQGVSVTAGQTTEVFLISQCKGEDPGAIDAIVALNREPVIEDVEFADSKFECGAPTEICVSASDPDNDPIEIALDAPGCEVEAIADDDSSSECWEVTCHTTGRVPMTALVYDQLHDEGELVRIEDWLTDEGYPSESHGQLEFFSYLDGISMWPDEDGDGYGDSGAPVVIICEDDDDDGLSDNNNDCDDGSASSYPGAEELCDDEADNDCDGDVNEDCTPPPGKDVVVFNDINPFDNTGMGSANNVTMVENLVNYVPAGTPTPPRGSATVVLMDRGRNSVCAGTTECSPASLSTMYGVINGQGLTVQDISSTSGSLTSFAADVKMIFLWNPMVAYTLDEINAFKSFADEGGRVVFVGEWDGYYGAGIGIENDFLLNLGAVMTNIGQAVDCGYNDLPASSLRPHQITTGMNGVRIACASVIVPGPSDYPLYYDSSNTLVLAGVATIDVTPSTSLDVAEPVTVQATELDTSSSTGE
jgi:hypothetical protein